MATRRAIRFRPQSRRVKPLSDDAATRILYPRGTRQSRFNLRAAIRETAPVVGCEPADLHALCLLAGSRALPRDMSKRDLTCWLLLAVEAH